jgi:hypothetical protein
MNRAFAGVSIAILALSLSVYRGRSQEAAESSVPIEVQMRNVNLHLDQFIILEIHSLTGQMVPTRDTKPVTLDDVNSFMTRIDSAEIAFSAKSLSDLLNRYVFAYPGAPLKEIVITMERDRLKLRGVMHKGLDLPFEVEGKLDVTADSEIRLHVTK